MLKMNRQRKQRANAVKLKSEAARNGVSVELAIGPYGALRHMGNIALSYARRSDFLNRYHKASSAAAARISTPRGPIKFLNDRAPTPTPSQIENISISYFYTLRGVGCPSVFSPFVLLILISVTKHFLATRSRIL